MKTYTGRGMIDMIRCARRHGLTRDNSVLTLKNKSDFDSSWNLRTKD